MLIYQGRVIDGERRDLLCLELGISFPQRRLATLEEACAALWLVHPDRAVRLAGTDRVLELARLCSVTPVQAAAQLKSMRPAARVERRAPRQHQGQKRVLIQFWAEPQFKHYMKLAGDAHSLDMSAALRESGWQYIQSTLPRAATEGSRRAPSVDHVRPRQRRRS